MYFFSSSLTVCQSSRSSLATSLIVADRHRRPTYTAKRLVYRGLSERKASFSRFTLPQLLQETLRTRIRRKTLVSAHDRSRTFRSVLS